MPTSITARYQWTLDEFLKAYKYHHRHRLRRGFRWTANAIAVGIVGLSSWSLLFVQFSVPSSLLIVAGLYWLFIRGIEKRWWLTRKFKKRPDRDAEIHWTFTDADIHSRSSKGEGRLEWTALVKWLETPEGFLMYPNEDLFIWLPYFSFENEKDVNSLVKLAHSRVPHAGKVG